MTEVIDVYNDPYGHRYYAHKKRVAFEKIKRTKEFKWWKIKQFNIQHGRCAYCQVALERKNIITHVDHVVPLFHEGTNDFSNLVLSCRRCNLRKWISNKHVIPDWVKKNKERYKTHATQARLMQQLVERELDEQMLEKLNEWIK